MSVQINSWEDGSVEGKFDTLAEAEAYVLEEDLDVVVYDFGGLDGRSYRFNARVAKLQAEQFMDKFEHVSRYVWQLVKEGYLLRVTVDGDHALAVVVNPQKEEVDATVFVGPRAFAEALWMLDSAVMFGE